MATVIHSFNLIGSVEMYFEHLAKLRVGHGDEQNIARSWSIFRTIVTDQDRFIYLQILILVPHIMCDTCVTDRVLCPLSSDSRDMFIEIYYSSLVLFHATFTHIC